MHTDSPDCDMTQTTHIDRPSPSRWQRMLGGLVLATFLVLAPLAAAALLHLALPWVRSQMTIARQRADVDALLQEVSRLGGQADYQTDLQGGILDLWVDFRSVALNDEKFESLAQNPGFKHVNLLDLSDTLITDRCLQSLSRVRPPGLVLLSVARTRFGDAGLAAITNLTTLRKIDVEGTEITDSGLEVFAAHSMSKNLASINFTNTRVTQVGTDKLSKAFPALSINNRSAKSVAR